MDNHLKAKKWNESISPRSKAIVAWFKNPEWAEGVRPYLNSLLESYRDELERPGSTDEFVKGQISVLKEIIALPALIEKQVEIAEKESPRPGGDAGY